MTWKLISIYRRREPDGLPQNCKNEFLGCGFAAAFGISCNQACLAWFECHLSPPQRPGLL